MTIQRLGKISTITLCSVTIIIFLSYKLFERSHRLSLVPNLLKVSKIIYAKEES